MARNALIQLRRDTAANWTSTNPTLAAGEMGFETDTGKLKIGTGSTAWTSLLYVTDASDITGTFSSLTVTGESSINNALNVTTVLAAGRGLNVRADPTDAQGIVQFTNNAVSAQWSSLVATNNLLTVTTPLTATSFNGSATDGTTTTGATGVGYMGLPHTTAATTGDYTILAADAGKHIYSTANRTVTIPSSGTTNMPIGTTIVFIAGSGVTVTIAISSSPTVNYLFLAGIGTTGSRTLAPFGMATAVKITSTEWIISGNGLT